MYIRSSCAGFQFLLLTTVLRASLSSKWGCDVTRYMSRHIDVTYEVIANYGDEAGERRTSSAGRLRGKFNLTNTGTQPVRRGRWQIFMSSFRQMQFSDNGTMLADSGLKAYISLFTNRTRIIIIIIIIIKSTFI